MNAKQLKVAQLVTSPEWIYWNIDSVDGELTFKKIYDDNGTVVLFASNSETIRWFQKNIIIQFTIGPRGGIKTKVY